MNIAKMVDEIGLALQANASENRRKFFEGYAASNLVTRGVAVPDIRAVVRDVSQRVKREAAEDVVALALALVDVGVTDDRQVGWEVLRRHKAAMQSLDVPTVETLGQGNDNWVCVDNYGTTIAGRAWIMGILDDSDVERWARSEDLWWRRTALVCAVTLNKKSHGGTGDTRRTLRICEILAADHQDMIVKAESWALRSLIPWDPASVASFVDEHPELHSRVKREVRHKLKTGRKNPR